MAVSAFAQNEQLTVASGGKVVAKRGETAVATLRITVKPGFHVNSNTPNEDFLIPLRLTWDPKPLSVDAVKFPTPKQDKFEFSEKALSVYEGEFVIETKFKVPADAATGMGLASGKLRYQACSNTACYPPKTVPVSIPLDIR